MPNQAVARDLARRRKVEAMRAAERAGRRRRLLAFGAAGTVVAVVLVLVVVKATVHQHTAAAAATTAAQGAVITQVTDVPGSVLDSVGAGQGVTPPIALSGAPALTQGGKPEVVYVGAEYCPFCAAERWSMVQALSRFGTFSGLGQTASSSTDSYPSTPTLSFHGATFTSEYLSFRGFEQTTNQPDGSGGYTKLDTVPSDVQALVTKYDAAPSIPSADAGSIPFVDLGGKALISGASYTPQVLAGKTHTQVAAALHDPASTIAQAAMGAANAITARLCDLTGDKPANVCTAKAVSAARAAQH